MALKVTKTSSHTRTSFAALPVWILTQVFLNESPKRKRVFIRFIFIFNQFAVIPHRKHFASSQTYGFNVVLRLSMVFGYIVAFGASVYNDMTIMPQHKPLILKIGKYFILDKILF